MRRSLGWFASMAWLFLASCATSPIQLDLTFAGSGARSVSAVPHVRFEPVTDARPAGDEAGEMGGRRVTLIHAVPWCESALHSLESHGETGTAENGGIAATVRLRRLHIESVSTTKATSVVLEIEYRVPGQPPVRKLYRGRDVSPNWASSTGEAASAFNAAMAQCLSLIRADLRQGVAIVSGQPHGG